MALKFGGTAATLRFGSSAASKLYYGSSLVWSASSTPGVPQSLTATAGLASVYLSWTAPSSSGSSPLTNYAIQYSSDSGSTWSTVSKSTSTLTFYTVTGLTNGTTYQFRVAAITAVGTGSYTSSVSATPTSSSTVPSAPVSLGANPGNASAVLSWSAPASNGGTPITDYTVEYYPAGASSWTTFSHTASTATAITVTGLTNGTAYIFRVAAVNSVGTGPYSPTALTTPQASATTASTPSTPTATAGNGQVSLSWSAPSSNGGATITDYSIQYSANAGSTWTSFAHTPSASTAATVTGLTNGTTYTFRVAAINSAGVGTYSSTTSATPTASVSMDYLIVAGGGGGGFSYGAGGGGGGGCVRSGTVSAAGGASYIVSVGGGGSAYPYDQNTSYTGGSGTDSFVALSSGGSVGSIVARALGGGGGGGGHTTASARAGINGGSGGGAAAGSLDTSDSASGGTADLTGGGYDGGASSANASCVRGGGGGGGAAAVGTAGSSAGGGAGGAGASSSLLGSTAYYGGGGGGGGDGRDTCSGLPSGVGGIGGGGAGGTPGTAGTAFTGGGGGGKSSQGGVISEYAGKGGSGVVILRLPRRATSTTGAPTEIQVGTNYCYVFNGSGSLTV